MTGFQRKQKLSHLSVLISSDLSYGLKTLGLMTHDSVILGLMTLMNKRDGLISHIKIQKHLNKSTINVCCNILLDKYHEKECLNKLYQLHLQNIKLGGIN